MTIEKHERSTKDLVKAAVSGWLGTALEFMDFKRHTCQLFDKYEINFSLLRYGAWLGQTRLTVYLTKLPVHYCFQTSIFRIPEIPFAHLHGPSGLL